MRITPIESNRQIGRVYVECTLAASDYVKLELKYKTNSVAFCRISRPFVTFGLNSASPHCTQVTPFETGSLEQLDQK